MKLLEEIELGTSRPVLVRDEDGVRWVLKLLDNPQGSKALFNELVAGRLAHLLGLPWPRVKVIRLSDQLASDLASRGRDVAVRDAFGSLFVDQLRPVQMPPGGVADLSTWDERNRTHVRAFFPGKALIAPFYGKEVFDQWTLMYDCKYDTLFIDELNRPVFLDASYAFAGPDWDPGRLQFDEARICGVQSPYNNGLLEDCDEFEPWLDKLSATTQSAIATCVADIPSSWGVPEGYVDALLAFLVRGRTELVPRFREELAYRRAVGR